MRADRSPILVWAALLVLLVLTVAASFVATGLPSLIAAMGIALLKAGLIFWFYMHLREEPGLIRLAAIGAAAWLSILFFLVFSDYLTRDVERTPPAGVTEAAEPAAGAGGSAAVDQTITSSSMAR